MHGKRTTRRDEAIVRLAERQYGVISRRQLMALGLSAEAVDVRLEGSRLHRIYQGVYAVGQRHLRREARWMAAVLAGGPGAVLSYRSAGVHWGLAHRDQVVEVTVPRRSRAREGIRSHEA